MVGNQRIYKQYVGQYNDLLKLKKWFLLYHHVFVNILKKTKSEEYINKKLKILGINYKYKQNNDLFKNHDVLKFEKIYYDFNEQFLHIENNEYLNFKDLENDKLILFNIIEMYYSNIYKLIINNNDKKFYKFSKNCISKIIPKSKEGKILDRIVQDISRILALVFLLIILMMILFILCAKVFIYIIGFLEFLPASIIAILDVFPQEGLTQFIAYMAIFLAFIFSLLLSIFICIKADKIIQKYLPEKGLAFARDLSENQMFLSNIAIIISFVSFVATILIAIYK